MSSPLRNAGCARRDLLPMGDLAARGRAARGDLPPRWGAKQSLADGQLARAQRRGVRLERYLVGCAPSLHVRAWSSRRRSGSSPSSEPAAGGPRGMSTCSRCSASSRSRSATIPDRRPRCSPSPFTLTLHPHPHPSPSPSRFTLHASPSPSLASSPQPSSRCSGGWRRQSAPIRGSPPSCASNKAARRRWVALAAVRSLRVGRRSVRC